MLQPHRVLRLLFLVALVAIPAARADVVKWTVSGQVTMFTGATAAIPFDIAVGSQYALTVNLDDDMPAAITGDVWSPYTSGFIDGTLIFANGSIPMTFSTSSGSMRVTNDSFSVRPTGIVVTDEIDTLLHANVVNGYNRNVSFSGSVVQPSPPTALTSRAFPESSVAQAFFALATTSSFSFNSDIEGRYYAAMTGTIDSVDVSVPAVPLPATAGVFSLAMLGLSRLRRRCVG